MKIQKIETFQVVWDTVLGNRPQRSAFVRITAEDGTTGLGEVSPMSLGLPSLSLIVQDIAPKLTGISVFDHAVGLERELHRLIKLGPEGVLSAAIAGLDIAFWDLKGKLLGQPVYNLLGGAWRRRHKFYASVGNIDRRSIDDLVRFVLKRVETERPAAVKIRLDGDRTGQDVDIAGDIAKAKAVRKALGDGFMLGFDASNGYSVGGAMQVGRALEDLGYSWFEEPLQHYHLGRTGEVAQRLDITVSAGEQTYTLQGVAALIEAGVRMVQPDLVKMGGITGLMQCAALAQAHGVEFVPHQTQPTVGHLANLHVLSTVMHAAKPAELADKWERALCVFETPGAPRDGVFTLTEAPGLGLVINEQELERRRVAITA